MPQAEITPSTGSVPFAPSTVITCVLATATKLYHTASCVPPIVQSPVSLLSVAPSVEPVVVEHVVFDVIEIAPEQVSFAGGGINGLKATKIAPFLSPAVNVAVALPVAPTVGFIAQAAQVVTFVP